MGQRKENSNRERIHSIFRVAFPLIIQGLVFQLQSLTDKAFLGNLDTKYMSAIGAAQMPYYTVVESVGAISIGLVIIIAKLYGAGEKEKIASFTKSTAFYNTLIGIVIFLLWETAAEPILAFFKTDAAIIDYSVTYVRICAFYLLFYGFDCTMYSMLQGMGITLPIMFAGFIKVGLNIAISWVLIFGKLGFPAMHVTGAAIGTLAANLMSSLITVLYCLVIKRKQFKLNHLDSNWLKVKPYVQVIKLGIPVGLEYLLWNTSNLLLIRFINGFGYLQTGIYTLTFGLQCIIYVVFEGVSKAALTLMGQSIGANNYKRSDGFFYISIVMNFFIVLAAAIVFCVIPKTLLGAFSDDAGLISACVPYLIFIGFIMFPQSINVLCGNGIKAHGNTKWMLVSQILGSTLVVSISCILVLGFKMDMMAIYATIFIDEAVRGGINFVYYRKKYGYHKSKNITENG